MKKGLLFVAVIAASLASCKKDHTCTCTTTTAAGFTGTPNTTTYPKSTNAAARANCLSSTWTSNGVDYTETCEVK